MLKSHWLVFISYLWKTTQFSLHHVMQHVADDYFVFSAILTNNEQCKGSSGQKTYVKKKSLQFSDLVHCHWSMNLCSHMERYDTEEFRFYGDQ